MNESGFSGRIHWIPLSAQIQKKKHTKKAEQIKMARIYVWEYVNKSPLYLFPLDFCSGVFFTSLPPPVPPLLLLAATPHISGHSRGLQAIKMSLQVLNCFVLSI